MEHYSITGELQKHQKPYIEEFFNDIETQYRLASMCYDKAEQVGEMSEIISHIRQQSVYSDDMADAIYESGYRKRRLGKWEFSDQDNNGNKKPHCSSCGEYHLSSWGDYNKCKYCPNCGANMCY